MKAILRLLFFWIKVIAVVMIVIAVGGSSFFIAMDVVNLTILVKDGMTMRANVVFDPEDYDADRLSKFFTAEYLASDSLLKNNPYDQYEIWDYDFNTKVERVWCWPWENKVTMTIACTQNILKGELKEDYKTQDQIDSGEDVPPTKLENSRYRVSCERIDDVWIVTGLEFMETFETEDIKYSVKEKEPETSEEPVEGEDAEGGEETPEE